jgi:predicted dehydrogenase
MAKEYLNVLYGKHDNIIVVGRSISKIESLKLEFPDAKYFSGGLDNYIKSGNKVSDVCFNCVSIENLFQTSIDLIKAGAKKILLEKPGALFQSDLVEMNDFALKFNTKLLIGYNRRFFASTTKLLELIIADGGITSINFEFTEWIHTINEKDYSLESLNKWILSNSSHVIDLVFYLIGMPNQIFCIQKGASNISWHPSGSIFLGCGVSENGIPFSYHSNWESSGRWNVEVSTVRGKYQLMPMEKIQFQERGRIGFHEIPINSENEILYKPGLFNQINSFLNNEDEFLVTLNRQLELMKIVNKIGGYNQ